MEAQMRRKRDRVVRCHLGVVVTPEGRALLERLRAEQERERQRMDKTLRRMRRDEAGNEPDE
jgi:hypothetical protein